MPTTYKVLGQTVTTQSSLSITNKALTSNVATLTLSAAHTVVGQQIQVFDTDHPRGRVRWCPHHYSGHQHDTLVACVTELKCTSAATTEP